MSTLHPILDSPKLRKLHWVGALSLLLAVAPLAAQVTTSLPLAQTNTVPPRENLVETASLSDLPDSPGASLTSGSGDPQGTPPPQPGQPSTSIKRPSIERRLFGLGRGDAERASHMASTTDKYILPGQLAPKLGRGDKIEFGLIHGVSAYGVLGWFVSAGYSHVINTSPSYGTDTGAYGQRLGAAALRGYSSEFLKDSVMANVYRQDPRYYKMGPSHTVFSRTAYSVSRILVTRNDDGHLAPNYSLLSGNLLGAALTNAYYPDANRGLGQTGRTFGSSLYGAAFSFFASEFLSGALEAIHFGENRK